MAMNKESMVIIVDVGVGAENLTNEAAKCCLEIIKHKIYNHKVDMMSFLLLRTEDTENGGNNEEPDQYLNICQVLPGSQIPTWYMAKQLKSSLEKKKSKSGDWVDALIVAIGIITEDATLHKTRTSKVVLFHNFDSPESSLDDEIIAKLNEMDFQLIIVSNNVHYVPDLGGNLCSAFKTTASKSPSQVKNEELAMRLVKAYPHTTLCNFNDALPIILRKNLKSPWVWNTTLSVGSRIVIHVSGLIAVKEEDKVPKFVKRSKDPNEFISREKKYFSGVDELTDPSSSDHITGYMLGNTPMQYDPSLGQASHVNTSKGIYFIGFVPAENIPQEHFSGSSTYFVIPQKGKRVSAQMMDSLVRAMLDSGMSILAWKVFNNGQKPKLVVLLPDLEHEVAGLSMIELSYHSQHRFWDFPKLTTKKNQPTIEQLAAVDELMAAMDLFGTEDKNQDQNQLPCDSIFREIFPFDSLPNIRQQDLLDFVAKSTIKQSESESSPSLVAVPDRLQPKASECAEKIKELFPLKTTEVPTKEKLKNIFNTNADPQAADNIGATTSSAAVEEEFKLTHIGTVTPAEDFTALLTHVIQRMPKGAERAAKFHQYACQMRAVISDLLFKSMTKQNEKVENALKAYRKVTIAANSSYDYNDWMREIRLKVIERKMFDFWDDVIVKQKLGLCMEDDMQAEEDFYNIPREVNTAADANLNMEDDESVEYLFGNL